MDSCYYYREYRLPKGNLDPSIDCTYVLIMHDSPREHQIYQHIMKAEPTSKVIFQYNFGYKKCDKTLRKNKPSIDLEDAYKTAFKHALERGYKRILVLEDDCEFDERIKDPEIVEDLNTFFIEKNPDVYNFGSASPLISPTDVVLGNKHQRLIWNVHTHATVYSENFMKTSSNRNFLFDASDMETNKYISKFTYKFPLAYQKLTGTENALESYPFLYTLTKSIIIEPSGIDKKVQPGYDNIKKVSDYLAVLSFVLCIILITFLIGKKM